MTQDQIPSLTPALASRNQSLVFAEWTLKNLQSIEDAREAGNKEVHVVIQCVVSLVGVVVFPWEEGVEEEIKRQKLEGLGPGWPKWDVFLGTSHTLGDLLKHIRNAVSHRRLQFSSDGADLSKVIIEFMDAPNNKPVNWRARITAHDLRLFLRAFVQLVRDTIG